MRERIAQMWNCGDEDCDCRQPQILERSTEGWRDPAWQPTVTVAEGPFYSAPIEAEFAEQVRWLVAAAAEYQVTNLEDIQHEYSEWLATCGEDVVGNRDQALV